MKVLLSFILGIVVGVGVHRYLSRPEPTTVPADSRAKNAPGDGEITRTTRNPFDSEKIKDELARTGKVIREKAQNATQTVADATVNARTTASIKAKLVKDSGLSAFKIDVDTTDGVVTLSGTVSSIEEIDRAMELALDTEGVKRVISTLQVKAK